MIYLSHHARDLGHMSCEVENKYRTVVAVVGGGGDVDDVDDAFMPSCLMPSSLICHSHHSIFYRDTGNSILY